MRATANAMGLGSARLVLGILTAVCLGIANPAAACFGARLRIGVTPEASHALASYATGYYVEEKTGIEPEFVAVDDDPAALFRDRKIDVFLASAGVALPDGALSRPAGEVPGVGPSRFWVHGDVLDDLRFHTVDRALGQLPDFFGSSAYRDARDSGEREKRAAREAVLRVQ